MLKKLVRVIHKVGTATKLNVSEDILENVFTMKEAFAEEVMTVDICTELQKQHDNVRNATKDQT